MKNKYESTEDIEALYKLLSFASMHTERIFDPIYSTFELVDYRNKLMALRAKLYYFLEEIDPNAAYIEALKKVTITKHMEDIKD